MPTTDSGDINKTSSGDGSKLFKGICFLVPYMFLFTGILLYRDFYIDDSYISMRYAKNMAHGLGLVFNAGNPVEGYTCPLWVYILSLGYLLDIDTILLSKCLGVLCAILLLFVSGRISKQLLGTSFLVSLMVATNLSLIIYSVSGMETCLFALLCLLSVQYKLAQPSKTAKYIIATAFAGWTRPEGILVFMALELFDIFQINKSGWKRILYNSLAFGLLIAPLFIFRLAYYGELLPNTFYAKQHHFYLPPGIVYSINFLNFLGGAAILIPVIIALTANDIWIKRLTVLIAVYTAYIVMEWGDFMPGFRFFLPLLPLVYLLTAAGLHQIADACSPARRNIFIKGVLILFILINLYSWYDHKSWRSTWEINHVIAGKKLAEIAPAGSIIAVHDAGAIPYYTDFVTLDIIGLTDKHIAHSTARKVTFKGVMHLIKSDPNYILNQHPDYIQLQGTLDDRMQNFIPGTIWSFDIAETAVFKKNYQPFMNEQGVIIFKRRAVAL